MQHHELEYSADQVIDGWGKGLLAPEDIVAEASRLLREIEADDSLPAPAADMAYRLRLASVHAQLDSAPTMDTFWELLKLDRLWAKDPDHYAVLNCHPSMVLEDGPPLTLQLLLHAPAILAANGVPRDDVETAFAHCHPRLGSASEQMLLRADTNECLRLHQQARALYDDLFILGDDDTAAAVAPLLALSTALGGDPDEALRLLNDVNADRLPSFEGMPNHDLLLPLAQYVDPDTSLGRAIVSVLGALRHNEDIRYLVRAATYMVKAGLVPEGIALVQESALMFLSPRRLAGELALLFTAVTEAGEGDLVFLEFSTPRWQREFGLDPQNPSAAQLAETFRAAAAVLPEKTIWDAPVKPFSREDIPGSPLLHLPFPHQPAIRFAHPGRKLDPEVASFVQKLPQDWTPEDVERAAGDDPQFMEAFQQLMSTSPELKVTVPNDFERICSDPHTKPAVRQIIGILTIMFSDQIGGPRTQAAVDVLPLVANERPKIGQALALTAAGDLLFADYDDRLGHDFLAFASALLDEEGITGELCHPIAELNSVSGHRLRSHWIAARRVSRFRLRPVEETGEFEKNLRLRDLQSLARAAQRLNDFGSAARYFSHALTEAAALEDAETTCRAAADAMIALIQIGDAPMASGIRENYEPEAKTDRRAEFFWAYGSLAVASALVDNSFAKVWPEVFGLFTSVAEDLKQAGDEEITVDMLKHLLSVQEVLFNNEKNDAAIELSAWANTFVADDELEARASVMPSHATALSRAGRHTEAVSAAETIIEWGQAQRRDDIVDLGIESLAMGELNTGDPRYTEALARYR